MYRNRKFGKSTRTKSTDSNDGKRALNTIDENSTIKIPVSLPVNVGAKLWNNILRIVCLLSSAYKMKMIKPMIVKFKMSKKCTAAKRIFPHHRSPLKDICHKGALLQLHWEGHSLAWTVHRDHQIHISNWSLWKPAYNWMRERILFCVSWNFWSCSPFFNKFLYYRLWSCSLCQ